MWHRSGCGSALNSISSSKFCPSWPREAYLRIVHWLCCPCPTSLARPCSPPLPFRLPKKGGGPVPAPLPSRAFPAAPSHSASGQPSLFLFPIATGAASAPSAPCPRPVAGEFHSHFLSLAAGALEARPGPAALAPRGVHQPESCPSL